MGVYGRNNYVSLPLSKWTIRSSPMIQSAQYQCLSAEVDTVLLMSVLSTDLRELATNH